MVSKPLATEVSQVVKFFSKQNITHFSYRWTMECYVNYELTQLSQLEDPWI